ncbi:MAG: hypothetical protein CSA39_01180 [Flavobacteriales bacterium]|nr:MAG: hypothetical protein CR989_00745 [Flavobacteriales bacterium]PIE49724.1 MAG: hypothetical protein CSA39_01180 [Flavobacteriales bacterium]
MLDIYRTIGLYSEILAAILATVFYFKYKNTGFRYIIWVLWLIVLAELLGLFHAELGLYYEDEKGIKYNSFIFNILYFLVYPMLFLIYYKSLSTSNYKKIIVLFFVLFLIVSIINWVFIQDILTAWSKYPDVLGSLFLTICIIFYFIELLQSEKIIRFQRSVPFWINVGLLVYYTSTIPFTVVADSLKFGDATQRKLYLINYVLSIAMYVIFSFGFIWSKRD